MFDQTKNFLGGIPDVLFTRLGGMIRKTSSRTQPEYMALLGGYPRLSDVKCSGDFFKLPNGAPNTRERSCEPFHDGHEIVHEFDSGYTVHNSQLRDDFSRFPLNRVSTVRLWRHPGSDRKEIILCLHGFLLGRPDLARRMFSVDNLFHKGADVSLYTLPHHGERSAGFLQQSLLCPHDLPLTIEGVAQAQHDLHATVLSLRKMGYRRIGLIGASLGAYMAILYATLVKDIEFVMAVVPAVDLHGYLMPRSSCFRFPVTGEMMDRSRELIDIITPQSYVPLLPVSRIHVVFHSGDRLNRHEQTRSWIKAWNVKNTVEIPGGHWLYFDRKLRGRFWYQTLGEYGFI